MSALPTEDGVSKREKELVKQEEALKKQLAELDEGIGRKRSALQDAREDLARLEQQETAAVVREAAGGPTTQADVLAVRQTIAEQRQTATELELTLAVLSQKREAVGRQLLPVQHERHRLYAERERVRLLAHQDELAVQAIEQFNGLRTTLLALHKAGVDGEKVGLPAVNSRFLGDNCMIFNALSGFMSPLGQEKLLVRLTPTSMPSQLREGTYLIPCGPEGVPRSAEPV